MRTLLLARSTRKGLCGLTDDAKQDGASGHKRSLPPFDPVAGMRAVADIQADGLRAASELLERMLGSDRDDPRRRSRSPERDYAALVHAWADLLQRVAGGLAQPGQAGAVTIPIDSSTVGAPVRLVLDVSDNSEGAVAEVWLHNGTASAVGPLALRCGQLTAPDGTVLDGAHLRFEPDEIELLPPRSNRAVLVSVTASGLLRPGVYRGTIQADGAPKLWLPLEVAIAAC
jgi:hypothetical protein